MTLDWRQHQEDQNCLITACGRFSVSYDHFVKTWRAWKMEPMGAWFAQISREPLESAEDAKAFCENHE